MTRQEVEERYRVIAQEVRTLRKRAQWWIAHIDLPARAEPEELMVLDGQVRRVERWRSRHETDKGEILSASLLAGDFHEVCNKLRETILEQEFLERELRRMRGS